MPRTTKVANVAVAYFPLPGSFVSGLTNVLSHTNKKTVFESSPKNAEVFYREFGTDAGYYTIPTPENPLPITWESVNNMIMLTTIPEGLCIVGLAFGLLLGGIFILAATAGKGKRTG